VLQRAAGLGQAYSGLAFQQRQPCSRLQCRDLLGDGGLGEEPVRQRNERRWATSLRIFRRLTLSMHDQSKA
jgi:hypothetical protein